MKNNIYVVTILFFTLLVSACSTKEVYEPKVVGSDWQKYEKFTHNIIDTSANIALLEERKVLTKNGEINVTVDKNKHAISLTDKWVISASIDGNLTLTSIANPLKKKEFQLKRTIATASVSKNILAVLFANDEMALYDIKTKNILFKEQGGKALAVDARVVAPHFLNDLVIFSTLDGKVVVVNSKLKKRLRTTIVSSESAFNNIIYFSIADNKIVAVTGYKILALSQKEKRQKFEVRNVVYDDTLYINTKQGEVIALNSNLETQQKVKFPFAHFLGMISTNDKLYILEKEGYMIVLDKKTFDYSVHEVDLDEGLVFVGDNAFYLNDEKILVE
ncbi:hypothetical protein [Sulfurimonas sp.]